jgi:hypothetical protein
MACRHMWVSLDRTVKNRIIVAETCRCVKCGSIRHEQGPGEPPPSSFVTRDNGENGCGNG